MQTVRIKEFTNVTDKMRSVNRWLKENGIDRDQLIDIKVNTVLDSKDQPFVSVYVLYEEDELDSIE